MWRQTKKATQRHNCLFACRCLPWAAILLFVFTATATAVDSVKLYGTQYVKLRDVASYLGMDTRWLESQKKVLLHSQWTQLQFQLHKRAFTINGNNVYMGNPVVLHQKELYISKRDLEWSVQPILTPQVFPKPPKLYRIVIDPGHGGKDPGAENKQVRINEKGTVLDLAKRLKSKLEAQGYEVVLTRSSDKFVSLKERPKIANRLRADLFISLHFNAVGDRGVSGAETFVITNPWQPSTNRSKLHSSDKRVYPGNQDAPWSALAGYYVQNAIVKNLKVKDRGLKRARFSVLVDLDCPGLLVEGGFISHPREARNIGSGRYRERLADAIVEGVLTYQRTLNRIRGKQES